MTRHPPPTIHILVIGTRGDHRPLASCSCDPLDAIDLLEGAGGRLFLVHRHAPERRAAADWHPLRSRDPDEPDGAA